MPDRLSDQPREVGRVQLAAQLADSLPGPQPAQAARQLPHVLGLATLPPQDGDAAFRAQALGMRLAVARPSFVRTSRCAPPRLREFHAWSSRRVFERT
jgi:hypothetical protein